MPAKKYKYPYRKTITLADGKRHDICAATTTYSRIKQTIFLVVFYLNVCYKRGMP